MQTKPNINTAQTFSSRSEILSGLRAAQSTVAAHSSWAEQNSRLHDDSFAAIVAAGIPRLFLPKSLGGFENPVVKLYPYGNRFFGKKNKKKQKTLRFRCHGHNKITRIQNVLKFLLCEKKSVGYLRAKIQRSLVSALDTRTSSLAHALECARHAILPRP